MSSIDTAWLRMDGPTNLMMIVGVMMFAAPMDVERFKRTLAHRLLRYQRFRQRVVQDATGAYWVDDDHFDIDNHVHTVNLPAPGDKSALQALAAALATQSLDHNKPLWTMTVVERYSGHGAAGSAVIVRIHHCIADGIALIGVMHSLTDEGPDAPEEGDAASHRAARRPGAGRAARDRDMLERLVEPLGDAAARALAKSGEFWSRYQDMLSHPDKVADAAKVAADVTTELAALTLLPADSPTSLKGTPSAIKRVAWSEPMSLPDIKAVCKVLGVSVNDILLSCCAGAFGAYLRARGEATDGVEVRGMVPVNLRPREQAHTLGNQFGLVLLALPVGIENPFVRLYEVKRRMDELKGSYQAAISMGILGAVGFLPRPLQKQVLDIFATKASAVMTNVPGPQKPLYLAGNLLEQQMFWVPQTGDIGVGVSILSYNSRVQFGLIADRNFVAEPARIVDRFAPEFEKLVFYLLVNGKPPGSPGDAPKPTARRPARAARAVRPPGRSRAR
ncbi:MAG: wax ester/triacylglycerol synthase family O-acyltransferase [Burkholderiales bacterium]|nr:wax ester/triacylglycerol synthase family O-acyltransferase [Burkholderiales bacterium]